MANVIELHLGEPLPLLNVWQRWHWRRRKRFTQRIGFELFLQVRALEKRPPLARCKVTITRKSTGTPDWDGLIPKAALDCLVRRTSTNPCGLNVIEDDNPACILELKVIPERVAKREQQGTTILIEEVTD